MVTYKNKDDNYRWLRKQIPADYRYLQLIKHDYYRLLQMIITNIIADKYKWWMRMITDNYRLLLMMVTY